MPHQYTPRQIAGFWTHVDKTGDCWLWLGHTSPRGYGRVLWLKRWHRVHRVSYELHYGTIPEGMCICHRCDVRNCVNPTHFFLGTHADNNLDMVAKGRQLRGEQLPQAKLTEADVRLMRDLYRAGGTTFTALATRFGVTRIVVSDAVLGKSWAHVH